ncbi:Binder of USO1 and GRH1 protein 1 [Nakaseomyces bracarensis]|uniref:Binder of USO1 and GRH1 protein 1 n=1 Tax=Nakaseomyces bracarensis TaxID=273131 RepID=A0ABR4NV65_9SACH
MSMDEEKRAKLEEARKRVEELKQKKNKKKNKKSKKKEEDTDEVKDASDQEELKGKELDEEVKEDELIEAEVKGEEVKEEEEVKAEEVKDGKVKDEEVKDEEVDETLKEQDDNEVEVKEEEQEKDDTSKDLDNSKADQTKEEVRSEHDDVDDLIREAESRLEKKDALDDMFDNDGGDFISTINKEKEAEEITRLKAEVERLTADNKKLKFSNIEHETTIEELQEENEKLKEMLNLTQKDLQDVKNELLQTQVKLNDDGQVSNKQSGAASPSLHFAKFNSNVPTAPAATSSQNAKVNTYGIVQNQNVDRVMLQKWRNWNIDMTTWRSIGSGPIVEF